MALSKTSYVILGMLRLGRSTGYEIKSFMDVSTRFFWAASYGQIYPELKRLEELGLARPTGAAGGGRQRKAYELTAEGDRELDAWLRSDEALHFELRHEGLLKLFFSDGLSAPDRAAQWRRTREAHEPVADQLRSIRPKAGVEPGTGKEMPLEVLEFGIAYQEFLIGYCKRMEEREA
jgi:DNA-binding PadR family transcriptional regulator